MRFGHAFAIAVAKDRFEHDPQALRHARNLAEAGGFERREGVVLTCNTGARREVLQGIEEVMRHGSSCL
jgi:hypothetical protein